MCHLTSHEDLYGQPAHQVVSNSSGQGLADSLRDFEHFAGARTEVRDASIRHDTELSRAQVSTGRRLQAGEGAVPICPPSALFCLNQTEPEPVACLPVSHPV